MRRTVLIAILGVSGAARADTFGGFSGVDRPYLVNQDRVCQPLAVDGGAARGQPSCTKGATDAIAALDFKTPAGKARFAATATGKTMTVTNAAGDVVVTWDALDPIDKIGDVYASQYEDRVAVAFTVRRLGKETTEIVGFELVKTTGRGPAPTAPTTAPTTTQPTPTAPPPEDPAVTKAVLAARKASKAKLLAAWKSVTALDPQHSEALFRIAAAEAGVKHSGDALAALAALAASSRADAIEWLVEARFDPAFAALRADPKFREAVGLDRPARTLYERVMGFGGQWEQTGTSCETATVKLVFARDRTFRLRVHTACEGEVVDLPFRGTWRLDGDHVILTVPTKGHAVSAKDEAPCLFERAGDEDSLHCTLDRDLDFSVLPTRR
ncbi:MAG TPA: hypothetical protein VLX92_02245 [Kofleriaceae bacterium]|nr:hypothetical protein [Kofleriaceae bacterium]